MSAVMQPLPATASPAAKFNYYLTKHKDQLALALPKHLNADRMTRLALTAFSSSGQLQQCEPRSVFAAVVLASQLGLEIGVSGQAYIVPYKDRDGNYIAQFIPGWQGIVDLVSRTGRATVWTGAVFDGDDFDYALGDRPFIRHRPEGESDPAKMQFAYAVGRVNGQEWPVIEVWSNARLKKHFAKNNKVGQRHYAYKHWEMYARKVALLQVCKYMPKSIELTAAMGAEIAHEQQRGFTFDGEFTTITEAPDEIGGGPDDLSAAHAPRSASANDERDGVRDAEPPKKEEPPAPRAAGNAAGVVSAGQLRMIRELAAQAGVAEDELKRDHQIADLEKISSSLAASIITSLSQASG